MCSSEVVQGSPPPRYHCMQSPTNTHSTSKPKRQGGEGIGKFDIISAPSFRLELLWFWEELGKMPSCKCGHENQRLQIRYGKGSPSPNLLTPAGTLYPEMTTSSFITRELFRTMGESLWERGKEKGDHVTSGTSLLQTYRTSQTVEQFLWHALFVSAIRVLIEGLGTLL